MKRREAIDLFAGAGGSTVGLEAAGWRVTWAGNHDREAVSVHSANHPETEHCKQDLQQADWRTVPPHELLWASPACQGHSPAASRYGNGRRGTAKNHDALRSTAWAAVSAAEVHLPRVAIVENVPAFRGWVLFGSWCEAWRALGYSLSEAVIDASLVGVPQERRRLFVVATRGRRAITLPEPRGKPVAAWEVVDLEAGAWRPLSDVPPGHRLRCEAAIEAHGSEGAVLVRAVTDHPFRSLSRPLPTITTQHQLGLVMRDGRSWVYRPFLGAEYSRGMGFPESYDWLGLGPSKIGHLAGNAVCPPVATWIAERVA